MKILICLLTLVAGLYAEAQAPTAENRMALPKKESPLLTRLYLLNLDMRYDRDNDQQLSNRYPFHLAIGFKKNTWAAVVEYTQFSEDSGNSTSSIKRTHREGVLWARWHVQEFKGKRNEFSFYGAGGLGLFQDEVKTTLNSEEATDTGGYKALGALAFGSEWMLLFRKSWGMVLNGEIRALASSEFDPNPNWGGLVGLGLQF